MTGLGDLLHFRRFTQRFVRVCASRCGTISQVMAEKDFIEMRGEILESLPSGSFRVKLENDREVIGHLAGKLRKNRIRVLPGDDVKVEISPYDLTKARITFRF